MKIFQSILPALFFLALAGCNNSADSPETKEDTITAEEEMVLPQVDEEFPELYTYISRQDSSFSVEGFEGGETEIKTDSSDQKVKDETLQTFLPYLVFNSDSSYAIDLVIYNYVPERRKGKLVLSEAGPDYEVALIDYRAKTRKPLLFFGTMGTIMDAKWADNQTVLIAGANEVKADSIRPVIWKYEVPTKAWSVYTYRNMIPAVANNYPKKWMNKED